MCEDCEQLRDRVDQLEDQVSVLTNLLEQITIPGEDTDSRKVEDFAVNGVPIGKALKRKTTESDVERIVDRLSDGDNNGVSTSAPRDKLLPVHDILVDVKTGNDEKVGAADRRASVFFDYIRRSANGDSVPEVKKTKNYYELDGQTAQDILVDREDVKRSSASELARRAFKQMQALTKVKDCDCDSIGGCDHGLIVFDGSAKVNVVRADKDRLHAYFMNLETAKAGGSDDESEQLSEDPKRAEAEIAEAADAKLDALADGGDVRSNTVVSTNTEAVLEQHDSS